jgi:hypothetical protein
MTELGMGVRISSAKRTVGLAFLLLAIAASVPAAASAQYPSSWHASTPPSWFTQTAGSTCQPQTHHQDFGGGSEAWYLWWTEPGEPIDGSQDRCHRVIPYATGLGPPGLLIVCDGLARHFIAPGVDQYLAVWSCHIGDPTACKRQLAYEEAPLGVPNEPYNNGNSDSGWFKPVTLEPDDCTLLLGPSPAEVTSEACDRAKQRVTKAKRTLKKADGAGAKAKAKRKLARTKKQRANACR